MKRASRAGLNGGAAGSNGEEDSSSSVLLLQQQGTADVVTSGAEMELELGASSGKTQANSEDHTNGTKKKKKKKQHHHKRKGGHGSSQEDDGENSDHNAKDKADEKPWWIRKLRTIVVELRTKMESDPGYRQRVIMNGMIVVTIILVMLMLFKQGGKSGRPGLSGARVSLGGGMIGSAKHGKLNRENQMLTKREREELEGVDVSGSDLFSVKRRFGTQEEILRAQEKERKVFNAKENSCFQFPPQVKRDSDKFTYYQPRKVFDLAVLQRSLKRMGWEQEKDLKKATLVLKGVPHVEFRKLQKGKMYYDMVSSLGRIGSKKKTQLATLRNYVKKFKCTFESLNIQPRSYDMNRPTDCRKLFEYPDTGKMWVLKSCKSGEGSKGAGISVVDDLSETRREWGSCQPNAFNYVIQEYIEHPLLIENRKFDMRAYLFVASTKPYIVFFNPGYLRRSLAEYKPTSTEKNDVLTNYHIQVNRADFSPQDAMWSFSQFIDYLRKADMCVACGDIEIQLSKIARLVFDSGREYYKRFPGSFQIVGLDFMMDKFLNPYFIEGNVSPGLGSHELKWKKDLMDDLVTLMYELVTKIAERPDEFDMRIGERIYGPKGNYWELIVHEQHESCDKSLRFNPCKELKPATGSSPDTDDEPDQEVGETKELDMVAEEEEDD